MNPIIDLQNISRDYVVGDQTIHALNNINLTIFEGEAVFVFGPSGSGKSTLLNIIGGLEVPSRGVVYVENHNLKELSDSALCQLRRGVIGYVFQFFHLHPQLSALENVELPMLIAGIKRAEREPRARELLEIVGLSERADHQPHELSGGEKQRVGIARALSNDPKIILADEPTGDMDSVTGRGIIGLFEKLNKEYGKTLIIVTHDESLVDKGMRFLHLEDGRITDDFIATERLEVPEYQPQVQEE
ncbi:MAG: ABC transporter ATP-binding protein [Candidatus Hermodarchaeota archaeon]